MRSLSPTSEHDKLTDAADKLQDWAIGLLDQIVHSDNAVDLLTHIPARAEPTPIGVTHRPSTARRAMLTLWPRSVLDEALQTPYPARRLAAHRHSKHVLRRYFVGIYPGSDACVPLGTTFVVLLLQCLRQALFFLPFLPQAVSVTTPQFPAYTSKADDEHDDRDEIYGNEEIGEDYFAQDHDLSEESSVAATYRDRFAAALGMVRSRQPTSDSSEAQGAPNENDEECLQAKSGSQSWRQQAVHPAKWIAFWGIPKVRLVTHSLASLVPILVLVMLLVSPHSGSAYRTETELNVTLPHAGVLSSGRVSGNWQSCLEIIFYILFLTRSMQEVEQVSRLGVGEYFSQFWNRIDVINICCNTTSMILRIYMWVYWDDATSFEDSHLLRVNQLQACRLTHQHIPQPSGEVVKVNLDISLLRPLPRQTTRACKLTIMWPRVLWQVDFLIFGMLGLVVRYIETLTYISALGEVWMILSQMVQDSWPVLFFGFLLSTFVGIALQAGHTISDEQKERHFQTFWFTGFWATLGEVDVLNELYESSGTRTELLFNWLPLLLWFFTFFTTIFLVNLMIAKMTTTYEDISKDHVYYRAVLEADLILEYKDALGAPPPFNVLSLAIQFFYNLCCAKRRDVAQNKKNEGYGVPMGRVATMRLQPQRYEMVKRLHELHQTQAAEQVDTQLSDVARSVESLHGEVAALKSLMCDVKVDLKNGIDGSVQDEIAAVIRVPDSAVILE